MPQNKESAALKCFLLINANSSLKMPPTRSHTKKAISHYFIATRKAIIKRKKKAKHQVTVRMSRNWNLCPLLVRM